MSDSAEEGEISYQSGEEVEQSQKQPNDNGNLQATPDYRTVRNNLRRKKRKISKKQKQQEDNKKRQHPMQNNFNNNFKNRHDNRKQNQQQQHGRNNHGAGGSKGKVVEFISSTYKTKKCEHYMKGACHKGDACQFSHDFPQQKSKKICKFFLTGSCQKDSNCFFSHNLKNYPCKFFHISKYCTIGADCRFSHEPVPQEEVQEYLEDNKTFIQELYNSGKLFDPFLINYIQEQNKSKRQDSANIATLPQFLRQQQLPTAQQDPHINQFQRNMTQNPQQKQQPQFMNMVNPLQSTQQRMPYTFIPAYPQNTSMMPGMFNPSKNVQAQMMAQQHLQMPGMLPQGSGFTPQHIQLIQAAQQQQQNLLQMQQNQMSQNMMMSRNLPMQMVNPIMGSSNPMNNPYFQPAYQQTNMDYRQFPSLSTKINQALPLNAGNTNLIANTATSKNLPQPNKAGLSQQNIGKGQKRESKNSTQRSSKSKPKSNQLPQNKRASGVPTQASFSARDQKVPSKLTKKNTIQQNQAQFSPKSNTNQHRQQIDDLVLPALHNQKPPAPPARVKREWILRPLGNTRRPSPVQTQSNREKDPLLACIDKFFTRVLSS